MTDQFRGQTPPLCWIAVFYHSINRQACHRIAEKQTKGTSLSQCSTNTQEQTGSDGAAKGDELDMSGLKSVAWSETRLILYLLLSLFARRIQIQAVTDPRET
jgi:hypothetical protein